MELSTSFSISSPLSPQPQPREREFEFQMSWETEPTTSPADDLFYKGKLLPLHLPPRFQMVQKLLQNSTCVYQHKKDSTPFEFCNASPSVSCRVSTGLNHKDYLFDYTALGAVAPAQVSSSNIINIGENPKKSNYWTKKHSSIASKLKASKAYLKSLFGKSDEYSCAAAAKVADGGSVSKANERLDGYMKSTTKVPFGQIHDQNKYQISTSVTKNNAGSCHRRSFSLAIKRHSTNKSSSIFSSNASNGFQYLQFLKRSSSVNAEMESPIQGAIAHCNLQAVSACEVKKDC